MITYANLIAALNTTGFLDAVLMVINTKTLNPKDLDTLLAAMDSLIQQYSARILDHTALVFTRYSYKRQKQPEEPGKLLSPKQLNNSIFLK